MSSADNLGPDPLGLGQAKELPGDLVHTQLVEALMHLLIEKGVLTRNDALSVVQTVAQVQRGGAVESGPRSLRVQSNLRMLQELYRSFDAVTDRLVVSQASFDNVRQLRPPVHGDRPEFPRDD